MTGPGEAPVQLVVLAEAHLWIEAADLVEHRAPVDAALHARHEPAVALDRVRAAADAEDRAARDGQRLAEGGLPARLGHAANAADFGLGILERLGRPAQEVRLGVTVG